MSSLMTRLERISCCRSWLFYCCFATWYAAVVLHKVQPCVRTGENQLLSLLVILLLFCYLMCSCHSPHGPALCPASRKSAALTTGYFTAIFLPGVQLSSSIWSSLVSGLERIGCCHFPLFSCCVATSCAAVVLHMVLPRDWTRENQLLSLPVIFLLFCYLVCSCRPPHGPASCSAGENQLLLLLVNFTIVCYLVCSCHPPHGRASCPDWREPASTIPGSAIPAPSPKGDGCFASASERLLHSCFKRKQRLLDSVKIYLSVLSPH
jgi:hypothetical protein